ncbi:MAG TPA: hypothetical protein VM821_06305, partial [Abditibacteriaceae bacterium]|nr:hypothetical protein [Abditibacteriaceae bacterium]
MRNYRNLFALAAVATSGALLSSCAPNTTTEQNNQAPTTQATSGAHQHKDGETHSDNESHSGVTAQGTTQSADASHGSTVHTHSTNLQFSSVPATLQAGKPGTMTLQIVDKGSGAPINDYEVVHDKKLHFIVVSSDLGFFNHIHPQFVGDGKFQIKTTLPRAGTYRLYADYKPQGKEGEVALQEINVGGATRVSGAPSSTRLTADTLRNGWMTKTV